MNNVINIIITKKKATSGIFNSNIKLEVGYMLERS